MAFAGFDSVAYPGDDVMAWLKANTNLSFAGYYLQSMVEDKAYNWPGRRATLVAQGWGLAPIFIPVHNPGFLTPSQAQMQGGQDGTVARDLMSAEGFPQKAVAYLSLEPILEQDAALSPSWSNYVATWFEVVGLSNFHTPGILCQPLAAASLLAFRPSSLVWCSKFQGAAPGPGYPPNLPANDPSGCGLATATLWQWAQQAILSGTPVGDIEVNLNCASVADPSVP